jgi:hypothetical protein
MNTRTDLETLKKINFVTSLNIPDKDFKRAEKILGICKSLNEEIKGEGELEGAIGVYIKVGEQFLETAPNFHLNAENSLIFGVDIGPQLLEKDRPVIYYYNKYRNYGSQNKIFFFYSEPTFEELKKTILLYKLVSRKFRNKKPIDSPKDPFEKLEDIHKELKSKLAGASKIIYGAADTSNFDTMLAEIYPGLMVEYPDLPELNVIKKSFIELPKDILDENLARYVYVHQRDNNSRICFLYSRLRGLYTWSNAINVLLIMNFNTDFQPFYDYADAGSLILIKGLSHARNNEVEEINFKPVLAFEQNLFQDKRFSDLEPYLFLDKLKEGTIVTADHIEKAEKRRLREIANKEDETSQSEIKISKFSNRLSRITEKEGMDFNGLMVYKDRVEYQGQILKTSHITPTSYLTAVGADKAHKDLNWDVYHEYFISSITDFILRRPNQRIEATIGEISIIGEQRSKEIEKIVNGRSIIIDSKFYYLNGIRINKDEIRSMLARATCFSDLETYENLLKTVRSCSLRIHQYLDSGLKIHINDPFSNERYTINIGLERFENKNFVVIGKKRFAIRDINRLIRLDESGIMFNLSEVLNVFENGEAAAPLDFESLKLLISLGKKRYINAKEKAEKLLTKTVKMFDLKEEIQKCSGVDRKGYVIDGKINKYFIVNHDPMNSGHEGNVFRYPSLGYVCIVDKSPNQQVGVDKIVNRIFALKNDSLLSKDIRTL